MLTIGLDIGGTKICGVVFNGKTVIKTITVATPQNLKSFKAVLKKTLEYLQSLNQIKALGIGFPGVVSHTGKVLYAPNLKYLEKVNLLNLLKFTQIKKIKIENDANCFALAEARKGAGIKFKHLVGVTLGTGIGAGLISHRQVYSGLHGSAGEVGHMMANENYTYEKLFQQYRDAKNYSALGKLLGRLFADIYNLLDIEAIILGGSVAKSADKFIANTNLELKKHLLNPYIKPKILISKLNNAGSIGAALLTQ
jgi:glucokinase